MHLIISCIVVALIASCAPTDPSHPKFVVAKGQGIEITRAELDGVLQPRLDRVQQSGREITNDQLYNMQKQALERMITDRLIYNEASKLGLAAEIEKQVEEQLTKTLSRFKSEEEKQSYFQKAKTSLEQMKTVRKSQVARRLVYEKKAEDGVTVKEEDAKAYYESTKDRWNVPERVQLLEVILRQRPDDDDATKAGAKKLADELVAQMKEGKDIKELTEYLKKKQVLGGKAFAKRSTYAKGRVDKQIEEVVFALEPEEVSKIVESRRGLHAYKLVQRFPASDKSYEDVRDRIVSNLERREKDKQRRELLQSLRESADVTVLLPEAEKEEPEENSDS
ncbi:MAG: peptidyl-prolyl cis-trans isomerase [Verrucomicrobiota bacterium]